MSLKLDGFLKPYRGKEDDLATFWSKFMVLANVQKWDTDAKKMAHAIDVGLGSVPSF